MIRAALLVLAALAALPGQEWWFVGDIAGQPSVSLRVVEPSSRINRQCPASAVSGT